MMDRRTFTGALAVSLLVGPRMVCAQAVPTIGFLRRTSAIGSAPFVDAFARGLNEAGFIDGRNVTIDYRWADGRTERLPTLAAELVRRQVAVIMAGGSEATIAAKAATATIPIVFATGDDPIKLGIVGSLSRPAGNITGISFGNSDLVVKRLELLRELVPKGATIGFLMNPTAKAGEVNRREVEAAARTVGQPIFVLSTSSERDFEKAFATLSQQRVGALIVGSGALFTNQREQIAALAMQYRLPAIFDIREGVEAGGLMSYGSSITDAYRQAGIYTGRVLKGGKPADLPILQPTTYELVINLKTARALGLTIPPSLSLRAELIE